MTSTIVLILPCLAALAAVTFAVLQYRRCRKVLAKQDRSHQQLCFDQTVLDAALNDSEARFKLLFNNAFEGIAITADQKIIECNQQMAAMFGYRRDEMIGRPVESLVAPDDRVTVQKYIESNYMHPYHHQGIHKDGSIVHLEVCGQRASYHNQTVRVTAVHDISEQTRAFKELSRLQSEMRQSTKMEAIGNFAAGIAHDFNNVLSPIIGYADMLMVDAAAEDRKAIESILTAADLAAKLVRQIQSFAKTNGGVPDLKPVDLKLVITDCFDFLRSAVPTTVDLQLEIRDRLAPVLAHETTLKQILLNLCKNASQALPAEIGRIVISARNYTIKTGDDHEMLAGQYVLIEVADDGVGMSKAVMERAIDPYYTTKENDRNTGVGLSVVRGIVDSFNSYLRIASRPGIGSRISIYIPKFNGAKVNTNPAPAAADSPLGGGQHILLIDDQAYVVDVIGGLLESLKYKVTGYGDSVAALDHFKDAPQKYAVVISDAVMPKLTGVKLLQKVKEINPAVKTILFSGLGSGCKSDDSIATTDIDLYLTKPATRDVFADALKDLLS